MRKTLASDKIHSIAQRAMAQFHPDFVTEIERAVNENEWVVVGMKQNPNPRRARKALDARGKSYHYLEYGSYFGEWRRRAALKMWTGWPTFPMVFVKGVLVGGADDLVKLIESGELDRMLSAGG